eukprot:6174914-Pleurochrysis_carterae.AAC.2
MALVSQADLRRRLAEHMRLLPASFFRNRRTQSRIANQLAAKQIFLYGDINGKGVANGREGGRRGQGDALETSLRVMPVKMKLRTAGYNDGGPSTPRRSVSYRQPVSASSSQYSSRVLIACTVLITPKSPLPLRLPFRAVVVAEYSVLLTM